MTSFGSTRLKFCQPKTLELFPHLEKTCGDCPVYNRKFQNCPLMIYLATYDPTALSADYYKYIMNKVKEYTTACELIEELNELEVEGEKIRYTMSKEELEQKKGIVEGDYLLGQEEKTDYCCVTCENVIEEFGTGEEIFFPRRRIICPNCSTGYLLKDDGRILIQTEHKDMLRKMYYKAAGSIPKELEEREPSFGYVIYDKEYADVKMLEDGSIALEICDNKVPLEKVQYVYFAGKEYVNLERFLNKFLDVRPDLFKFTVNRTQREENEIELRDGCEPFTLKQYHGLQGFVDFISKEKILNSPILKARQLSNIGALLKYRKMLQEKKGKLATKVNKQLANMNDLLLIVQSGINSSFYGRQLEGLNQDCLFDLIKELGEKVGLWTHGRVNSRLVNDPFLSSTIRSSNASSPLDALINQMLRQFRYIIKKIYQKLGWKPSSLGPGFYHKRKSKSDIDRKGLYFDFDEPVGSLALLTLLKALTDGLFSIDDCSLETDGKGREVYRVKNSSLKKIEKLVDEALSEPVFYKGENIPFLNAFEEDLFVFRQAVEKWLLISKDGKKPTREIIDQCIDTAGYFPFVFCPAGCEEELTIINNSTKKYSFFFDGREEHVLAARESREAFREKGRKKWLVSNGKKGKAKLKLTKHQMKEQERSLLLVLLMLQLGYQMNGFYGHYSTNQIKELLQLNQNQSQRILTKMVDQGLLLKMKSESHCYYQLNLESETVHELLFSLEQVSIKDPKKRKALMENSSNVHERISSFLLKVQQAKEGLRVTIGWKGWKIPRNIEPIIELVDEKLANSREKLRKKMQ